MSDSTALLPSHRSTVDQIHTVLRGAQRVLLGTHEHPDADAVGSSLALLHALRLQGKRVTAYLPDPAPFFLEFLPGFSELTTVIPDASAFDVVVLLDYTTLDRTHLADQVTTHPSTVCIDHHYDNPGQANLNLIVPEAGATAHILTEFFDMTGTPLTNDIATCLLTGIFADTGSFMHESTTPEILKIAARLMKHGARLSHIAHETYQKKDLPGLQMWGRALSRVMVNETTGAAVSVVTFDDFTECQANLDDLSGVVNMLNSLPQVRFALLLAEYAPGKIKGSLRSEPHKGMDVSKLAKYLGGGGHKLAAGFEVPGHITRQDGVWRVVPVASSPASV